MIRRIFHPIGQGAFYSERHKNFNMVYDCGTLPKTKISEKLVKQSFRKSDNIDLLFISHFDSDHINQIETLKNHCSKIKVVILPLLEEFEKKMLTFIYRSIDKSILPIINTPETFFDKNTKIVYVSPGEFPNQDDFPPINIEDLERGQTIKSSVKIMKDKDWVFIPYNHKFTDRHDALIELLKSNSIDPNDLKSQLRLALTNGAVLRDVYNKLEGKINQNSMFVYSGPILEWVVERKIPYYKIPFNHYRLMANKPSCIYTGDGDLNSANIEDIFRRNFDMVGTIQIPHHGDLKSFNSKPFLEGHFCCPISVGTKNTYAHPSSLVIAELSAHHNIPILVNETIESLYFEVIDYPLV